MDVKEIKKLIDLMVKNDLRELEIKNGDSRVSLKRGPGEGSGMVAAAGQVQVQPVSMAPAAAVQNDTAGPGEDEGTESIVSPMVGTFYQAASPENDAFVQVGDTISDDTVICIVEAMKVMNEIKAGVSGTVEKILVSNGEAVEFGQPMFKVRPA